MIVYILLLVVVVVSILWLSRFIFEHAETITITWGAWGSYEINSTNLLIVLIFSFVVFYFLIWLLKLLFGMKKNVQNYQKTRWMTKVRDELTQGLLLLTAGHWKDSEALLLRNIAHAETPLLNYLAAARAAHMQENYDHRDQYLKKAAENGESARIAVAVSQAEMQLTSNQIEQARATLVHLLELSPHHPFASKLLAKVYYQQEDWNNLFELLPQLKKQNLLREKRQNKFEADTLKGIFQKTALKKQPKALQLLWGKLPTTSKIKPQVLLHYIDALIATDDARLAEKILLKTLNKNWDSGLIERFGKMEHVSLDKSIQQAEEWLLEHDNSPELLFCLARLYRSNKCWEKSCYFYELGLNMMPDPKSYLEFAELLAQLNDDKNSTICYQKGLRYCITKKGEALYFKTKNIADPSKTLKTEEDVEKFYTI